MKQITGNFRWHERTDSERPAAGAMMEIRLPHAQKAILIDGQKMTPDDERWPRYEITLDESGAIPAGTFIISNDEMEPEGLGYEVMINPSADDPDLSFPSYDFYLRLIGDGPIDIAGIVEANIEERGNTNSANLTWENIPLPAQKPAPRVATIRKPSSNANHIGFCAGSISYPHSVTSFHPPVGRFVWQTFTLPFPAVISCATVFVEECSVNAAVEFALYDANGKRVRQGSIDCSESGMRSVAFDALTLRPGDYTIACSGSSCLRLRCAAPNEERIHFAHAAGGEAIAGVTRGPLPETLVRGDQCEDQPAEALQVPLVYFKA